MSVSGPRRCSLPALASDATQWGAKALVCGDVPVHHVAVGMPAKSVRVEPGWESVAADTGRLPDDSETRRIEYDLPDDPERVNEFQRDLAPPDEADADE